MQFEKLQPNGWRLNPAQNAGCPPARSTAIGRASRADTQRAAATYIF
jgi:hypothetical protein